MPPLDAPDAGADEEWVFDKKVRLKPGYDLWSSLFSLYAVSTLRKDLTGSLMVQRERTDKPLARVLVSLTLLGSHQN